MTYKYRSARCKVEDIDLLRQFRRRRKQWIDWLHGPIRKEITGMMTDDTLFHTINEARGIAQKAPKKSVMFNGLTGAFIDRGHVHIQLMAIRRLLDRRRDTISVHNLLADIKRNKRLITRENYVAYDGLPYEYEDIHERWIRSLPMDGGPTMRRVPSEGPKAWMASQRVHERFDQLSDVVADNRSRTDLIQNRMFRDLFSRLKECSDIENAASEVIAHIPAKEFHGRTRSRKFKITLHNIEKAQRAICKVVTIIDGPLLWESSSTLVAMPHYGHLVGFEKGWTTEKGLRALYDIWTQRSEEVDGWANFQWPS